MYRNHSSKVPTTALSRPKLALQKETIKVTSIRRIKIEGEVSLKCEETIYLLRYFLYPLFGSPFIVQNVTLPLRIDYVP